MRFTLWRRYASDGEEIAMTDSESVADSTESTAVGRLVGPGSTSPNEGFPLAFYTKPSPLAKKPAALRPVPARPLATAIEESSSDESSDDGDPVVAPWDAARFGGIDHSASGGFVEAAAKRSPSSSSSATSALALAAASSSSRRSSSASKRRRGSSATTAATSARKKTTTTTMLPTRILATNTPATTAATSARRKKKTKKTKTRRPMPPAPPPSKASIARSARSLSARAKSAAQSVADMKDRLFFDEEEASARAAEFDRVCDLLDDVADDVEEDVTLGDERVAEIRAALQALEHLWALTDDLRDRVAERCRSISSSIGDPREGFASKCRVRQVGPDGEAALRGQNECLAEAFIGEGETAPYPGVVVSSLAEQKALLAPLRPIDRVKWSCFSYSFSSHLPDDDQDDDGDDDAMAKEDEEDDALALKDDATNPLQGAEEGSVLKKKRKKKPAFFPDETFCPELWPVLDGAMMTYVNDACGPENRTEKRLAERQNVEYVETFDDPSRPSTWRVDVRATKDVFAEDVLLSDYGSEYWLNWKEHIHTRAMKRLDQRLNDLFAPALVRDGPRRVRVESRTNQWLRLAEAFDRRQRGLPPVVDEQDFYFEDDDDDVLDVFSAEDDDDDDDDEDDEDMGFLSSDDGVFPTRPPKENKDPLRVPPNVVSSSSSTTSTAKPFKRGSSQKKVVAKKRTPPAPAAALSKSSASKSASKSASSSQKKKRQQPAARPAAASSSSSSSSGGGIASSSSSSSLPPKKKKSPKKRVSSSSTGPPLPGTPSKKMKNGRARVSPPPSSWRSYLGSTVSYVDRSKGYRTSPAIAAQLAVDADSTDDTLVALYEATLVADPSPRFEAWWDDGQPYPLRALRPTPKTAAELSGRTFDVHFVDGEKATVSRVVPVLEPSVWAKLERFPAGAWVRPRCVPGHRSWGTVVRSRATEQATVEYDVQMDFSKEIRTYADADLEPILVVRGTDVDGAWQEAAPISQLEPAPPPP